MYKILDLTNLPETHFLSAQTVVFQTAPLSSFFQLFIILGMYNLILKQNSGKREEDFELSWVSVSGFLYSIQLQTWNNGMKSYLNAYLLILIRECDSTGSWCNCKSNLRISILALVDLGTPVLLFYQLSSRKLLWWIKRFPLKFPRIQFLSYDV